MSEKRYTITIGLNNEFKEIIDHCRQDKHISVFEFLKQVEEQYKAFKKLKKENKELKDKLFEVEKDYLIETADISDKLYLDEEISKLKKEVYGDFE